MRVTSKGQVTIPIEIRQQLGIGPDSEVEFTLNGDVVELRKRPETDGKARRVLARLLAVPYRGPSTEELLAFTRGEK